MKWVFYVIVFVYMFYRAVYGLNAKSFAGNQIVRLEDSSDYKDGIFVEAGERKMISCKASSKNQKVEWYNPKGFAVSRLHTSRVFATSFFVKSPSTPALLLNITQADLHDSGVWVCRAGDEVRNISLCVIDPTDFEGTPAEVAADEGRSYTLSCQTRGQPDAIITWTRNGEVISENDYQDVPKYRVMTKFNRQGIEGLLTIMSLNLEDSGVYTCVSTQNTALADKCGLIETYNITLNINHEPTFGDKKKENVYGTESENLLLRCEADGYPVPTYNWFVRNNGRTPVRIDDKEIVQPENSSASVLPVKLTEDSFDHQYICRASNQLGDDELIFDILESTVPKKPVKVQMLSDMSTSKILALNMVWDEEIQFDIKTIEAQLIQSTQVPRKRELKERDWKHSKPYLAPVTDPFEDGTTRIATLTGLEPSTEYWVRLRVKNDIGESLWSNAIQVKTRDADDGEEGEEESEDERETKEDQTENSTESETDVTDDDSLVTTEPQATPPSDESGRFYGLFFGVGVLLVAVGCTFIVRMV